MLIYLIGLIEISFLFYYLDTWNNEKLMLLSDNIEIYSNKYEFHEHLFFEN